MHGYQFHENETEIGRPNISAIIVNSNKGELAVSSNTHSRSVWFEQISYMDDASTEDNVKRVGRWDQGLSPMHQ